MACHSPHTPCVLLHTPTARPCRSPRNSWPDELLSTAQLWPGDVESEDDAAAITREERTLRAWINSVLHRGSTSTLSTAPDPPLSHSHSHSVDSDRLPRQGTERTADGAGGVFRSSSAGAAAVATQLEGARAGGSSSLVHSRSISADAQGAAAEDLSLDGWGCAEPAAPTTPTAAAAAAAAAAGSAPAAPAGGRASAAAVPSISSVSSLFGPELRSGVLLLEILELLQPGCVDQRLVNRPPFVSRTAQLKALENCNLALKVAQVCVWGRALSAAGTEPAGLCKLALSDSVVSMRCVLSRCCCQF
jgi:hypothetical protein